jgi:histidinol-phosphate/aromatic aminotransferase/cobyric acid decarboxylase-like protein
MIKLSSQEKEIARKIRVLKEEAGSHSPNIFTLVEKIPEMSIHVDACFLSNPYATNLFLNYLDKELVGTNKLRDVLEFYPSQNRVIASLIAEHLNVSRDNVFIGNGAIEIIQAVIHNFVKNKIVVNIPTFSSYYEFVKKECEVVFYQLSKKLNYELDIDEYVGFIKKENPDTIVIINPNNPDGGYISYDNLRRILIELKEVDNIIIDESFIHFAYEDDDYSLKDTTGLFNEFNNVIVIKSMSKDFGIAGIRAGYALMDRYKINRLLENGYLWNFNGLSEYFFRLYVRSDFLTDYETIRVKYIRESQKFFESLSQLSSIKTYPSKANFALVELLDGSTSADFVSKLLIKEGIYTRNCSDKIGLQGEFVRIASRSFDENKLIINAIKNCFS